MEHKKKAKHNDVKNILRQIFFVKKNATCRYEINLYLPAVPTNECNNGTSHEFREPVLPDFPGQLSKL